MSSEQQNDEKTIPFISTDSATNTTIDGSTTSGRGNNGSSTSGKSDRLSPNSLSAAPRTQPASESSSSLDSSSSYSGDAKARLEDYPLEVLLLFLLYVASGAAPKSLTVGTTVRNHASVMILVAYVRDDDSTEKDEQTLTAAINAMMELIVNSVTTLEGTKLFSAVKEEQTSPVPAAFDITFVVTHIHKARVSHSRSRLDERLSKWNEVSVPTVKGPAKPLNLLIESGLVQFCLDGNDQNNNVTTMSQSESNFGKLTQRIKELAGELSKEDLLDYWEECAPLNKQRVLSKIILGEHLHNNEAKPSDPSFLPVKEHVLVATARALLSIQQKLNADMKKSSDSMDVDGAMKERESKFWIMEYVPADLLSELCRHGCLDYEQFIKWMQHDRDDISMKEVEDWINKISSTMRSEEKTDDAQEAMELEDSRRHKRKSSPRAKQGRLQSS